MFVCFCCLWGHVCCSSEGWTVLVRDSSVDFRGTDCQNENYSLVTPVPPRCLLSVHTCVVRLGTDVCAYATDVRWLIKLQYFKTSSFPFAHYLRPLCFALLHMCTRFMSAHDLGLFAFFSLRCRWLCKCICVWPEAAVAHVPSSCVFCRWGEYLNWQGTGFRSQRGFTSAPTTFLLLSCCLTDGMDPNQDTHCHIKWGCAVWILQSDTPYINTHMYAEFTAVEKNIFCETFLPSVGQTEPSGEILNLCQ